MEKNTQAQEKQENKINKMRLINQEDIRKIRFKIEIAVLIILIAIGGYLIYKKVTEKPEQPIVEEPECEVLYENCRNISCKYYDLCNTVDFETCTIYDCGSGIKAEITDKQGNVTIKEREKTDMTEVYKIIQACKGTTQIISNQCVAGKKELKVQVETKGDCPINSFVVNQGKNDYAPRFEEKDGYFYLTLENCNQVEELITIGKNGALVK